MGNIYVLVQVNNTTCAHRQLRIINNNGDRVCLHCGKTIYLPLYYGIVNERDFPTA
jgi:hypothetical protein